MMDLDNIGPKTTWLWVKTKPDTAYFIAATNRGRASSLRVFDAANGMSLNLLRNTRNWREVWPDLARTAVQLAPVHSVNLARECRMVIPTELFEDFVRQVEKQGLRTSPRQVVPHKTLAELYLRKVA